MFHVVLYQPEIPPNTGNIIRLCANTGCTLHLIEPLGFSLEDRQLKRAGLDYREFASVLSYRDFNDWLRRTAPRRLFAFSTHGRRDYEKVDYTAGDALLFGPETRGLPTTILANPVVSDCLRIPMVPGSRSLNLSNTVAVVVYEAWRQRGFSGGQ